MDTIIEGHACASSRCPGKNRRNRPRHEPPNQSALSSALVTLTGHKQWVRALAWTQNGTTLVSGSSDGTVRVWEIRSDRNYAAELLLEKVSDRCLLVDEVVEKFEADRTIAPELRAHTIELARRRGNAISNVLFLEAWKTAQSPTRPNQEYRKAMRRAAVAVPLAPWYARGWVILALVQYRTGNYDEALLSANRAIEIQKAQAPDAHAVRAMAYYRLRDLKQAEKELEMGLEAKHISQAGDESSLLEEAQRGAMRRPNRSLLSPESSIFRPF